jgi:hypothetical protein
MMVIGEDFKNLHFAKCLFSEVKIYIVLRFLR